MGYRYFSELVTDAEESKYRQDLHPNSSILAQNLFHRDSNSVRTLGPEGEVNPKISNFENNNWNISTGNQFASAYFARYSFAEN